MAVQRLRGGLEVASLTEVTLRQGQRVWASSIRERSCAITKGRGSHPERAEALKLKEEKQRLVYGAIITSCAHTLGAYRGASCSGAPGQRPSLLLQHCVWGKAQEASAQETDKSLLHPRAVSPAPPAQPACQVGAPPRCVWEGSLTTLDSSHSLLNPAELHCHHPSNHPHLRKQQLSMHSL